MQPGTPSRTALVAAFYRAHHCAHDDPVIFADTFAERLLTEEERTAIEEAQIERLRALDPVRAASCPDRATAVRCALRESPASHVLARARYTEDRLLVALARGVGQYVLIGAGLDTFAFRRPDLGGRVAVVEIDHPATQAFKRARLAAVGLEPPPGMYFAACDFERESVVEALARVAFDGDSPAFFAWLGVTMYLTREAIRATLRAVRRVAAPGSELVLDYIDAAAFDRRTSTSGVRATLERALRVGEAIITGFAPDAMAAELSGAGFRLVEDLGPEAQEARYFHGRTDGLHAREFDHVVSAAAA